MGLLFDELRHGFFDMETSEKIENKFGLKDGTELDKNILVQTILDTIFAEDPSSELLKITSSSYNLLAPFISKYVKEKEISQEIVNLVLTTPEFQTFLVTLFLFGYYFHEMELETGLTIEEKRTKLDSEEIDKLVCLARVSATLSKLEELGLNIDKYVKQFNEFMQDGDTARVAELKLIVIVGKDINKLEDKKE